MLKYILIASFLSVQAIACPNLSGTYICEDTDGGSDKYEQTITQSAKNGIVHYVIVSDDDRSEIISDGKSHQLSDEDNSSYTATCTSSSVLNLIIISKDEEISVKGDLNISANTEAYLMKGKMEVFENGKMIFDQNIDQTCDRK